MKKLKQGTLVNYNLGDESGLSGQGRIVGIANETPFIGFMYIIQISKPVCDGYQYNTFVLPECYLKEVIE